MDETPRAKASKAKRMIRSNSAERPAQEPDATVAVKISKLHFEVDADTKRKIEEERSKIRDTLGLTE